jgi:hypothetical protein
MKRIPQEKYGFEDRIPEKYGLDFNDLEKYGLENTTQTQKEEKPMKTKFISNFERAKKSLIKWSLLTKFDCYSKIFETKHWLLQLTWLSLFVIFTAFTSYFVAKNIIDFFVYETISKIEIINEKPTEFPVITICNANPYTTLTASDLITNIIQSNFDTPFEALNSWEMLDNYSSVYDLVKLYTNRHDYSNENKKLLGNQIVVNKCIFNGEPCSIDRDFSWYFSYLYGNCIQFNTGGNTMLNVYKTQTEGPVFGLWLILTLPKNQNKYPTLSGHGFKIYIHNKTLDPMIPEEINYEVGKDIDVAISKTFTYKTPEPYSECKDLTAFTSPLMQVLAGANKTYRQFDCIKLCLQKNISEFCGCYYSKYLRVLNDVPACLNLSQLNCIYSQQNNFIPNEECFEQCPLECNIVTYTIQTSSVDFPSKSSYENLLNSTSFVESFQNYSGETFSLDSIKDYMISLKIYYPFTRYTLITELPKTSWFELFAQIGGSMGMLLGFSIFHFIELGEIVILILWSLLSYRP